MREENKMAKSKKEQETDFHSLDVEAMKANIEAQEQEVIRRNIEVCISVAKITAGVATINSADIRTEAITKMSELIKKLKS